MCPNRKSPKGIGQQCMAFLPTFRRLFLTKSPLDQTGLTSFTFGIRLEHSLHKEIPSGGFTTYEQEMQEERFLRIILVNFFGLVKCLSKQFMVLRLHLLRCNTCLSGIMYVMSNILGLSLNPESGVACVHLCL